MCSFIKIAGNYTDWNIYRKSVIICDVTEMFVRRAFIPPNRTIDQMRQAARSCKQNIVEGVSDASVSSEMCIKLLGVARGSVRELLEDYCDFLRQNRHEIWSLSDERTQKTRAYCAHYDDPIAFVSKCEQRSNEAVANIMITQIKQIDSMLAKLIQKVETEFLENGGIREAMTAARKKKRGY